MSSNPVIAFLLGAATTAAVPFVASRAQQQPKPPPSPQQQAPQPPAAPSPEEMMKMFEDAKKFTEPSESHKLLGEYLGKWDVDWKMTMGPGEPTSMGKWTAETTWLVEGKFTQSVMKGEFMGKQGTAWAWTGYDNFKKAYVRATIDSMQTPIVTAQGKTTQDGRTLILYGTIDEYLTGENDKMVKYVTRWIDADHFVEEVHDLAIGEEHTKVMEFHFSRAK